MKWHKKLEQKMMQDWIKKKTELGNKLCVSAPMRKLQSLNLLIKQI